MIDVEANEYATKKGKQEYKKEVGKCMQDKKIRSG